MGSDAAVGARPGLVVPEVTEPLIRACDEFALYAHFPFCNLLCNLELSLDRIPESLAPALEALTKFEDDGLVTRDAKKVRVTTLGRFFLRNLCLPFDAYLPARTADRVFSRTL